MMGEKLHLFCGCTLVTLSFLWGVPQVGIPDWVALCFLGFGGFALLLAAIVALRQRGWTFRRGVAYKRDDNRRFVLDSLF
jgi:hypothetical protein